MPSIFEKVKSAFVEEVPDPKAQETHSAVKNTSTEVPAVVSSGGAFHKADVDPQALAKLEDALTQAMPSLYTHFNEQFESLREVIPDEITRFKAALKTSHATAEQILSALEQLFRVLEHAKSEFMDQFTANLNKVKMAAEQSLAATDELIKSKEAQLKAIQDEIASHRSKREADVQHLNSEQTHLEGVRDSFQAALAQVTNRLTIQKEKISAMPKG